MKKEERVLLLLLLNALIEYSVSGKSDVRGQGSGMVAELNVGNLFLGVVSNQIPVGLKNQTAISNGLGKQFVQLLFIKLE